jgi:ABC-type nitrate/sulfonate/bicarbonate transport system substrate-binding protein
MNSIHHSNENFAYGFGRHRKGSGTGAAVSVALAHFSPTLLKKQRDTQHVIRIGFVALTDCAPIVMAQELGLFEKYGLKVELTREIGWATIRDRVLYGELDAAHAPAGMMVAATNGLGCGKVDCLTGLVLNLHGNAITLSQKLWRAGVRDGASLRTHVRKSRRRLTLGVVFQWSSHSVLLRLWLKRHQLEMGRDVEVIVVPPSQALYHLQASHLDGFCAGEPWNSLAVQARAGWVVARSAELAPFHPEKVLMVRREFATRSHGEHLSLIAALLESAEFCDVVENRERIAAVLARPEYVGAPVASISAGMCGVFDYGNGRIEQCPDFNLFSRNNGNEPDANKARWVVESLVESGLATADQISPRTAARCFRADIFAEARALLKPSRVPSAA